MATSQTNATSIYERICPSQPWKRQIVASGAAHAEKQTALPLDSHICPFWMGRHEGNHRAEGGHGLSDIDAVNEKLLARGEPPGVMVAKISHSLEDRKPLEPGQLGCRVWIRRIWHPEISAGPHDSFDDFIA